MQQLNKIWILITFIKRFLIHFLNIITPLQLANENGQQEIVNLLLEHKGIDVNKKDEV